MTSYIVLLRGINVGGKNKLPMAKLKAHLEELGFEEVETFIQSGNVLLRSAMGAKAVADKIEQSLTKAFKLDSDLIRILALTDKQLRAIVKDKPKGFGDKPDTYHSDAIFLMGISVKEAMKVFSPKEGVDKVWPGKDVIYSQRLSAQRTKSRLNKIIGMPAYASMTIRNWNTTTKLLGLLEKRAAA